MHVEENELNQIAAAQRALGKSVASILETSCGDDFDEKALEEVGRQLVKYSKRLQEGIPRATPFQLFRIATDNVDTSSKEEHRIMIVIDDGQPGDVGLPGATTQCPRCGYHF